MVENGSLETLIPAEPVDGKKPLSRRQFLAGAATGGAVGLAAAVGAGVAAGKIVATQSQVELEARDAEIARLQGLLRLYEEMDDVGLDSILKGAMAALALPLGAIETGAKALQAGLVWVEGVLMTLRASLPDAQDALLWLEGQVEAVSDSLQKLQLALEKALDRATGSPVAGAVRDLVDAVLDRLPFGLGDKIHDAFEGLVRLVTGVDELVQGISTRVLNPLRDVGVSGTPSTGLGSVFVDPLVEHVLDPLAAHLEDLAALADTWQSQLAAPAQGALAERTRIREEIAQYKQENGLA
jgi:hypothetical protein